MEENENRSVNNSSRRGSGAPPAGSKFVLAAAPSLNGFKIIDLTAFKTLVKSSPLGLAICVVESSHVISNQKAAMVTGLLWTPADHFNGNRYRLVLDPRVLDAFLKTAGGVFCRAKAYLVKTPLGCTLNAVEHLRSSISRIEFTGSFSPAEAHQVALSFRKQKTELICPWQSWATFSRWTAEYGKRLKLALRVQNVVEFLSWLTVTRPSEVYEVLARHGVTTILGLNIPHLADTWRPRSATEIFIRLYSSSPTKPLTPGEAIWEDDFLDKVARDNPTLRMDFDEYFSPEFSQPSVILSSVDFLATIMNRVFKINDFVCFCELTNDAKTSLVNLNIRAGYLVHRVGTWCLIRSGYNYYVVPITDGVFKLHRLTDYVTMQVAASGALVAVSIKAGDLRLAIIKDAVETTTTTTPPIQPPVASTPTRRKRASAKKTPTSSPRTSEGISTLTADYENRNLYQFTLLNHGSQTQGATDEGTVLQSSNPLLLSFIAFTGCGYDEVCAFRRRGMTADILDIPKALHRNFPRQFPAWELRLLHQTYDTLRTDLTAQSLEALTDEMSSANPDLYDKATPRGGGGGGGPKRKRAPTGTPIADAGQRPTKRLRVDGSTQADPPRQQPVSSEKFSLPGGFNADSIRLRLISSLRFLASLRLNVIGNQETGRLIRFTKTFAAIRAGDAGPEATRNSEKEPRVLKDVYPLQWDLFLGDCPESKLRKEFVQKLSDKMNTKVSPAPQRVRTRRQKLQDEQSSSACGDLSHAGSVELLREFLSSEGVSSAVAFGLGESEGPPADRPSDISAFTFIDGGAVDCIMGGLPTFPVSGEHESDDLGSLLLMPSAATKGGEEEKRLPKRLSMSEALSLRDQLKTVLEKLPRSKARWAAQVANSMAQLVLEGRIRSADYIDLITQAGSMEPMVISQSAPPSCVNPPKENEELLRQLIDNRPPPPPPPAV